MNIWPFIEDKCSPDSTHFARTVINKSKQARKTADEAIKTASLVLSKKTPEITNKEILLDSEDTWFVCTPQMKKSSNSIQNIEKMLNELSPNKEKVKIVLGSENTWFICLNKIEEILKEEVLKREDGTTVSNQRCNEERRGDSDRRKNPDRRILNDRRKGERRQNERRCTVTNILEGRRHIDRRNNNNNRRNTLMKGEEK